MTGLPTTPNGFKHAICGAVQDQHPDWPYKLSLDVAARLYRRWSAAA